MVRTQTAACDEDGEPFAPMSVELILDNPQIALRQLGNGDPTVMRGPGADDLADLGAGFYLDFPGDALTPGCIYEQDHDRFNAGQPSVVYAHIVHDDEHPDVLALQYWLYWYYNDWNNKHESDWEFVQLLFPAGSVTEALATEPVSVGYAQHEGGEWADWDDAKLRREGTHPVVYSSQRSHASYFEPAVYIGRSASEGFGCDHTESPSTRIEPDVVVLPDRGRRPGDPLAWIGFEGRWGERHGGPNNGPTGPNTKPQWSDPVAWQDDLPRLVLRRPRRRHAAPPRSSMRSAASSGGDRCSTSTSSRRRPASSSPSRCSAPPSCSSCGARRGVASLRPRCGGDVVPARSSAWPPPSSDATPPPSRTAAALAVPLAVLAALVGIVFSQAPVIGAFVEVADPTDAGAAPGDLDDHRECRHRAAVHVHLGARGGRPR